MKKAIALLFVLLIPLLVTAGQEEKTILLYISWQDGKYEIEKPLVVMEPRTEMRASGNYLAKLKDQAGKTLYQLKVAKPVDLNPPPYDLSGEELEEWYEERKKSGYMILFLPFLENAKTVSFEHGKSILAEEDLGILCNNNGECGERENYLSCEEDCPLEKEDEYCTGVADGICDPDCSQGIDPDCAGGTPGPSRTAEPTPGEEAEGTDFTGIAIFGGIAAVVLLIFLGKKRK